VKETVRMKAVDRLRESEKTYVDALTSCVDEVLNPLVSSGIITEEDAWNVFGPLKVLRIYHSNLLTRIQATISAWQDHISTIGDVFYDNTEFFPLYSLYIRNYAYSMIYYRRLRVTNSRFVKFCEAYDRKHLGGYTLTDVLGLPYDRIDTYPPILQAIMKYTAKSHMDSGMLEKCYQRVFYLSNRISYLPARNAITETRELVAVADSIQGMEGQCLITPGRRVVHSGVVSMTRLDQGGQDLMADPRECMLILFNDLLVCCDIAANEDAKHSSFSPAPSSEAFRNRQRRAMSAARPVDLYLNSPNSQLFGVPGSLSVVSSLPVKSISNLVSEDDRLGRPCLKVESESCDIWCFHASVDDDEILEWEDVLVQAQQEQEQDETKQDGSTVDGKK